MGPFRAWQVSRAGKKANCYNSLLRIRHCNSSLSSWLPPRRSTSTASSPSSREPGRHRLPGLYPTGAGGRAQVGAAAQPVRGVTRYLVRWRGHTSADDEWLLLKELAHCPEKVRSSPSPTPPGRARRRARACSSRSPARAVTTCGARPVLLRGFVRSCDRPGPRRPAGALLLADLRQGSRDGGAA